MIAPARSAAYSILRLVNTGQADLPAAIARFRPQLEDERDKALAAEIAAGTLRWLGELDFIVERLARRRVERLDPEVLDVVRMSMYQLVHLDKIPPAAVVNDAVALTKRARKTSAAGFVNAVLRSVRTEEVKAALPSRPTLESVAAGDPLAHNAALDYLSITLSHPRWLARRWLERYGFAAAEAWMAFNNRPAPLMLRANTLRTTRADLIRSLQTHGVVTRPAAFAPDGLAVVDGNPFRTPLAAKGVFHVQDEASQLVAALTLVRPGERVLDVCAAPGGKTITLAAAAGRTGTVIAADVRGSRIALMRRVMAEAGVRAPIVQHDLTRGLPFEDAFDCVLMDAPCSGLGTVRRDPEIRWRRNEPDLAKLAAAQTAMLTAAAGGVKVGGRLVYATCSSEPDENEAVVTEFLESHPQFAQIHPLRSDTGRDAPSGLQAVVNDEGYLRTYPHVHGLEAFFGAVLRRLR
jgi:16S rRNA (cytosine967-C5)-methyltransferase